MYVCCVFYVYECSGRVRIYTSHVFKNIAAQGQKRVLDGIWEPHSN